VIRSPVYIAEILVPSHIAAKVNEKHNVTVAEVREAVVLTMLISAVREPLADGSERLLVKGKTYNGRALKVVLYLVDENLGVWRLATAMPDARA